MQRIYQYSLQCLTDGVREYYIGTSAPGVCPSNPSHVIDPASVVQLRDMSYTQWYAWLASQPTPPALAVYQSARIGQLAESITAYLRSHYDPDRVSSLQMLYQVAIVDGTTPNRAAHIRASMDWAVLVLGEFSARTGQVMTATTIAEVNAVPDYDWGAFDIAHPDPAVTIPSALAILD